MLPPRDELEKIVETIPDGVIILDKDGRITFANATAEKLLGLTRSQIVGRAYNAPEWKRMTVEGKPYPEEELPFAQAMRTGKSVYGVEVVIEHPDGTKVTLSINVSPLNDEKGNVIGVVASLTDITERKRAEEKLKESERRFRKMLEEVELVAVTLDARGKITFVNDFLLNLTGWQRNEAVGKDWFEIFIPEDEREKVRNFFFDSIAKGEILAHYENDIITSFDERRTISFTNVLLRDSKGQIIGSASIGHDITEEKRAAEEIRESRQQVLDILESITDGFFAVDNDWRFTYVNHKAEELLGKRKEELLFRSMWDAFPEVVGTRFYEVFTAAKEKMTPLSLEEFYPPLNKWFEVHVYPYKNGLSGYFDDVSKRKHTEEALKTSEKKFRNVVSSLGEGVFMLDKEVRLTFMNPEAERLLGWSESELIGKDAHKTIHYQRADGTPILPEDCPVLKVIKTGNVYRTEDDVFTRKDGSIFPVAYVSTPIKENGKVVGSLTAFQDITKRKQIEEEHKQLIDRLELLLQSTDEGIYGVDTKDNCTFINRAALEMLGLKLEEMLGKNTHRLMHYKRSDGSIYPEKECPVYRANQTGQGIRLDTDVFFRKDGTSFPVEYSSYPIIDKGVIKGSVVYFTNITERKQAQRLSGALNDINKSITSTLDFDEIMQRVVVESAKAIGSETAAIDTYENHQWVTKYIYGFPQEVRGVVLTNEEAPHAQLAARTREQVVINDALNDTRVNRKTMEKFNIKSVMVTPLVVRGEVAGTLFFNYHSAPVSFTDAQIDFANKVAASVSLALENARLYEAQRNIADTLQEALLMVPENVPGLTYGYLYRSATEAARVGGDFYDIFELEQGKVGIVIGDVAGKGIEAAALTTVVRSTIKAHAYEDGTPAVVMSKTNDFITRISQPDSFVTVFFGVVDMQTGRLTYCNAGHPPAIIKSKSGTVELLEKHSPVIGAFPGMNYRSAKESLEEGDILLLYTDGIVEARCKDGEFFKEERLVELIRKLSVSTREIPQTIFNTVMSCTGGILSDDVALLSLAR